MFFTENISTIRLSHLVVENISRVFSIPTLYHADCQRNLIRRFWLCSYVLFPIRGYICAFDRTVLQCLFMKSWTLRIWLVIFWRFSRSENIFWLFDWSPCWDLLTNRIFCSVMPWECNHIFELRDVDVLLKVMDKTTCITISRLCLNNLHFLRNGMHFYITKLLP